MVYTDSGTGGRSDACPVRVNPEAIMPSETSLSQEDGYYVTPLTAGS